MRSSSPSAAAAAETEAHLSDDIRPLIRGPRSARPGQTVPVKTLATQEKDFGQRRDASGTPIPRRIINRFAAHDNGRPVIEMDLERAISANPSREFEAVVHGPGAFIFTWYDDDGSVDAHRQDMAVA